MRERALWGTKALLVLPSSIDIGVFSPNEFQGTAKGFVPPSQGSVDDVFSITADSNKAAIWIVHKRLGVEITGAQVLDSQRHSLTLLQRQEGLVR